MECSHFALNSHLCVELIVPINKLPLQLEKESAAHLNKTLLAEEENMMNVLLALWSLHERVL